VRSKAKGKKEEKGEEKRKMGAQPERGHEQRAVPYI
jgi:hypothetical protein